MRKDVLNIFLDFIKSLFLPFKKRKAFIIALIAFFIIGHLFILRYFPLTVNIKPGEKALFDIIAPKNYLYVDIKATENLRKQVADSVLPIYKFDSNKEKETVTKIRTIFEKIEEINSNKSLTPDLKKELYDKVTEDVSVSIKNYLVKESTTRLTYLESLTEGIASSLMRKGIISQEMSVVLKDMVPLVDKLDIQKEEKAFLKIVLKNTLSPNLIYDETATQEARKKARESIQPIYTNIYKGQVLVKKGEIITNEQFELLSQLGIVLSVNSFKIILGIFITIMLFVLFLYTSYNAFKEKAFISQDSIILIAISILISTIISFFLSEISPYFIPFNLIPLLALFFFNIGISLTFTIATGFFYGMMFTLPAFLIMLFILSASLSILFLRKMKRISDIILAGIFSGIFLFIGILTFDALSSQFTRNTLINGFYGFLSGFLSSLIALGLILSMERIFNFTTTTRLLELSDTGNPLLKDMFLKAPGTYHHSILVGNIAANAALKINANWLLAKVGGFYHDVGKVLHPYFFGENKGTLPNIHEDIDVESSRKIILSHVKDSFEILKKHNFPRSIVDIAQEHHGTTVMKYFYSKAKGSNYDTREDLFRYSGPKPQSKESAIVFLADGIEASVRSIPSLNLVNLNDVIQNLVDERIKDGQLKDSELTFKDVEEIKQSFVYSISSLYHLRDEYPPLKEEKT